MFERSKRNDRTERKLPAPSPTCSSQSAAHAESAGVIDRLRTAIGLGSSMSIARALSPCIAPDGSAVTVSRRPSTIRAASSTGGVHVNFGA